MARKAKRKPKVPNTISEVRDEARLDPAFGLTGFCILDEIFCLARLWDLFFLATKHTPETELLVVIERCDDQGCGVVSNDIIGSHTR